eukprot:gene4510-817_t
MGGLSALSGPQGPLANSSHVLWQQSVPSMQPHDQSTVHAYPDPLSRAQGSHIQSRPPTIQNQDADDGLPLPLPQLASLDPDDFATPINSAPTSPVSGASHDDNPDGVLTTHPHLSSVCLEVPQHSHGIPKATGTPKSPMLAPFVGLTPEISVTEPPPPKCMVKYCNDSASVNTAGSCRPVCGAHQNVLFYIERNKNHNLVLYSWSLKKNSLIVQVQWQNYAVDGGLEDLNWFERKFAYGVDTSVNTAASCKAVLKALSSRPLQVFKDTQGQVHATARTSSGELVELLSVYVMADEQSSLPKVMHIDLYGFDTDSKKFVKETIVP